MPELDNPQLSIKKPVVEKYGKFSDEFAISYYTNLAKKFGGRIDMEFRYGHAICNKNLLKSKFTKIKCRLVSEISDILVPGYFLSSIVKVKVNNKEKFFSELTLQEQRLVDAPIMNSILTLLQNVNRSN